MKEFHTPKIQFNRHSLYIQQKHGIFFLYSFVMDFNSSQSNKIIRCVRKDKALNET